MKEKIKEQNDKLKRELNNKSGKEMCEERYKEKEEKQGSFYI